MTSLYAYHAIFKPPGLPVLPTAAPLVMPSAPRLYMVEPPLPVAAAFEPLENPSVPDWPVRLISPPLAVAPAVPSWIRLPVEPGEPVEPLAVIVVKV